MYSRGLTVEGYWARYRGQPGVPAAAAGETTVPDSGAGLCDLFPGFGKDGRRAGLNARRRRAADASHRPGADGKTETADAG